MRYNKGAIALLADGQCLIRESWTDGSYLKMIDGEIYRIWMKNGKEVKKLFDPNTQSCFADDYNFKRTYDDHSS